MQSFDVSGIGATSNWNRVIRTGDLAIFDITGGTVYGVNALWYVTNTASYTKSLHC